MMRFGISCRISIIYAFDNVAFPYGEKSEEFIVERVLEIVTAVQKRAILWRWPLSPVTASTVSLPALRDKFPFPVVGVVPAIKPAARLTANGIVGLLATRGTVKRPYTRELIDRFANECQIAMLGSAELVEMAEAKLHETRSSTGRAAPHFASVAVRMPEPPDTVVLGCTHFPLLQEELLAVLPEGTRLVDSGAAIARRTAWLLEHEAPDAKSTDANIAFCMAITKETEQLLPVLHRYGFETLEKLAL